MLCVLTTDDPVLCGDGSYYQKLLHGEAVDLSELTHGLPVLAEHGGAVVGRIPVVTVEESRTLGEVEWWIEDDPVVEDYKLGFRRNTSIEGAYDHIEHSTFRGLPLDVITAWRPVAIAITPSPKNGFCGML